jgi:propanol-preferring alcohol dehydrogenase
MILEKTAGMAENPNPLRLVDMHEPAPGQRELLVRVSACGVCHTELDEIEGRTPPSELPRVLGHQVVGRVEALGPGAGRFKVGDRVGVPWLYSTCGQCRFCRAGEENLCPDFQATGRDANGGYAEYMTVPEAFAHAIPARISDIEAAPLLCAGAVGYRAFRLANLKDGQNLGLMGFGGSNHLVLMMARHRYPNGKVFAYSRSEGERAFARELGAYWAGDFDEPPPELLDAVIDTTPVWKPIVNALTYLNPGGRLVVNAIRKEDADKDQLLRIEYPTHLWLEKEIKSVANVTRRDVDEFLQLAAEIPIKPTVEEYRLEDANRALLEMKNRKIRGAKVLNLN